MRKVTEGVGIISGDGECWCIDPIQPEPPKEPIERWIRWEERRVYPNAFFPEEVGAMGRLRGKIIRYKIAVEIEEAQK